MNPPDDDDDAPPVDDVSDAYLDWTLTPEGEASLQRAIQARGIIHAFTGGQPTEAEPTMAIPSARAVADRMAGHLAAAAQAVHGRAVADEARELARSRASAARDRADAYAWLEEQAAHRNQEIAGDPPTSL